MNRRNFLKNSTVFELSFSLGRATTSRATVAGADGGRRRFLELRPDPAAPRLVFFSIDGLSHGNVVTEVALHPLPAPDGAGSRLLDRLFAKMDEVGFRDFGLGLPGNLVPIRRADYTDLNPCWGEGRREDNRDGFQVP